MADPGQALPVTLPRATEDQLTQEIPRGNPTRRIEAGEIQGVEVEGKDAAIGDLTAVVDQVGIGLKPLPHGGRIAKMEVSHLFFRVFLIQQGPGADTLDDVVFSPVCGAEIVDTRGGDRGEVGGIAQLPGGPGAGNPEVEGLGKKGSEAIISTDGEKAGGVEIKARGRGAWIHNTTRIAHGKRRSGVQDAAEILIAPGILDVDKQGLAIDLELGTDQRLDPGPGRRPEKRDRAVEVPGIGEPHRGDLVRDREVDDSPGGEDGVHQ